MKKAFNFVMCMWAIITIASCNSKSKSEDEDSDIHIVNIHTDSTLYGICGPNSTKDTFFFITESEDTLKLVLKEETSLKGSLIEGNRLAVVLQESQKDVAVSVINISQLLGEWVEPNPIEEGALEGVQLLEGGAATSINSRSTFYKSWNIYNGKLVLVSTGSDFASSEEMVDTFSITLLTQDSLRLKGIEYQFFFGKNKGEKKQRFNEEYMDSMTAVDL